MSTMRAVWKYELRITDTQLLQMPRSAEVLTVANQGGKLCIWVLLDPSDTPLVNRRFLVVGTGNACSVDDYEYLGSAVISPFVWHVFHSITESEVSDAYP